MERKIYEPIVPSYKMKTSLEKNLDKSPDDSSTRSNDISIEALADPLQMFMQKRLSGLPGEPHKDKQVTIYRVPASFREKRKALYEPRMVSIGPYYHGREELRSMEEHKWWLLRDFMSRKPEIGLDIYLQAIRELESKARQCYSESVKISADEFVLMLLLDGCFILEYFLKYKDKETDILCDIGWGGPTIISDLLLLENQIPFFIIHKLASFLSYLNNGQSCEGDCILAKNLSSLLPYQEMLIMPQKLSCETIKHLLHLYYICMIPKSYTEHLHHPAMKQSLSWLWIRVPQQLREGGSGSCSCSGKGSQRSLVIIPCADELHDSGVQFKRSSSHQLFDIKFNNGVIEMPLLVLDNTIRTIFTNIVAFEQSQISRLRIFTSYVVLWNMLVDTGRDVSLLEHCGILEFVQHNEEQAADFFNELANCWLMDYNHHHYADLFLKLQKYCSSSCSTWHRSRAKLMQDYFNNPWRSISVVGAVILLILTFIQTYFSIYPDGVGKSSTRNK